jgi:hypothetical protein
VVDPRTGEILKGHVALGSLRVRHDYLLALGLVGEANTSGDVDPLLEMALARLRQLSAHEVGHTLGLRHNFAASVSRRASVMDYPAPLVRLDPSGDIDLSEAYAEGVGEWDRYAIRYGYAAFGTDEETIEGLRQILADGSGAGLRYITDRDARPPGSAHPFAHLWDNGADPVEALELEMEVRRRAMRKLGLAAVSSGQPVATLEEVLVPLYLRHRYQLEAVAKLLAGVSYEYAVSGDAFEGPTAVAPEKQRDALEALLQSVRPAELEIPLSLRSMIPPRPPGFEDGRELFPGTTGLTFDPLSPGVGVADFVFALILDPHRLSRLNFQRLESPAQPDVTEVLSRISEAVRVRSSPERTHTAELRRLVEVAWVRGLLRTLDRDPNPSVRAAVRGELMALMNQYSTSGGEVVSQKEQLHRRWVADLIERYLDREIEDDTFMEATPLPPGSPIGG